MNTVQMAISRGRNKAQPCCTGFKALAPRFRLVSSQNTLNTRMWQLVKITLEPLPTVDKNCLRTNNIGVLQVATANVEYPRPLVYRANVII